MPYKNRKTESDYDRPVMCANCGRTEGTFYRDTDDNDILCDQCIIELPSEEYLRYEDAKESVVNLDVKERNGKAWISCAECGETIDYFSLEDESSLESAADMLERDDPEQEGHECETDEEDDDEEEDNAE